MHIVRLVSRLFKLFIPFFIEKVAKSTGFMKRHSKLLPETFAKAVSLGILDSKNITEEVNALENHQSLLLNYFSDVKLLDATTISLPNQVADDYTGMGGYNAKSALKIQTYKIMMPISIHKNVSFYTGIL
ncbi:hypothetical protein [Cellulosilyticum ruminicola]|uniref:hypothetical protein n=1 Tax=Cellulosilyticum ruminicola TaxID=425254 RepID=UPI0006D0BB01|nr:hypothetical protein [Cellulosilyticum ruminicola]